MNTIKKQKLKDILNKIKNNRKFKNAIYNEFIFEKIILIASVILKYKNACLINNDIFEKKILKILTNEFNLYIYEHKKDGLIISNTEINNVNKLSTFELGKILSYMTPMTPTDMKKTHLPTNIFCYVKIKFRNTNNQTDKILTSRFMTQQIIDKSKPDIYNYLDKYVIAVNDIAKYIDNNYIIISVKKIIKTLGNINEKHTKLLTKKKK